MILPEYIVNVMAYNSDEVLSIKKSPFNKNQLLVGSIDDTLSLLDIDQNNIVF